MEPNPNGALSLRKELLDTQVARGPWTMGPVGDFLDSWVGNF